jgi:hypothetical protein
MAKQKYVPTSPEPDHEVVAGIGPNVDLDSLPVNIVTDAVQKQADPALLRAGVEDPFLPSEPVNKETTKTQGTPMSDRNYNKAPSPFIADAPKQSTRKSMSHSGTVIEKR